MHRNRTWSLDLPEWRTQRNRVLAAEGGDGSTLSLDFTSGTLDPRFTVTRGSTSTFVNSEGFVELTPSNMLSNSVFAGASGATPPTGWLSSFVGGTGSFTLNGTELTISNNGSATRSRIYQTGPTGIGLPVTVQLKVVANNTSGMSLVELLAFSINGTAPSTSVVYRVNGITQLSSFTGWGAGDTVTLTCTPAVGSAATCLFGLGASAVVSTSASVTIKDIQIEPGSVARSYIPTTTSGAYYAPRFDFNPTTIQLNGLLIEPANTNKATTSETLANFSNNNTIFPAPISTTVANPAGALNTLKIAANNTTNYHARGFAYTTPVNTQEELTFSVWLKSNGYTKAILADGNSGRVAATFDLATGVAFMDTGTNGGSFAIRRCRMTAYRNGWWRCEISCIAPADPAGLTFSFSFMGYPDTGTTINQFGVQYTGTGNENDGIYAYGPQLEVGPIATSYIPTGTAAGGATRNADTVTSTNVNWFTSSNAFTLLADFIPLTPVSSSVFPQILSLYDTTAGGTFSYGCNLYYVSVVASNLHTMTLQTKLTSTSNTDSTVATLQTYGQRHKLAYAVNGTTSHIRSLDGSSVTTSPAAPTAALASGLVDTLYLGHQATSNYMTGWLRGIKYWPSTKPIEELNRLTDLSAPSPTFEYDFTVGSIPATMTYTIGSNATFVNSSGVVEWGNANMYWNTAFEGLSGSNPSLTSSGWSYALSTGGNAVFNGDGTLTITTTAAERRAIFRSSGFSGGGLRVVASVDVTIASGSLSASQVIVTGTPINAQHYVNGVAWNSLHPLWNGGILPVGTQFNIAYATDSLTSGTTSVYFGVGCTSIIAGSATFSNPRWTMWKGSGTVPYYPNTSATNSSTVNYFKANDYYAPRFDYNPQTSPPEALGILNEAAATNIVKYSQDLNQVSGVNQWYGAAFNTPTIPASPPTDPFGGTTSSWKLVASAGTGIHSWRFAATFTATSYTFSFWAKAAEYDRVVLSDPGGGRGGCIFVLIGNGTATAITGTTTPTNPTIIKYGNSGWYRCSVTMTMTALLYGMGVAGYPSATTPDAFGANYTADGTSGVYVTGMQAELYTGTSSYIPTGASQVTRNATSLIVNDITPFSYNREGGTMYVEHRVSKAPSSNTYTMRVGFGTAAGLPVFEMFPSGLSWFTAIRGDSLEASGSNERSLAYVLNTNYKYAVAFNTRYNPILSLYQNTTFATINAGVKSSGPSRLPNRFALQRLDATIQEAAGTIKSVKYWPIVLTAQQLKTLTQ